MILSLNPSCLIMSVILATTFICYMYVALILQEEGNLMLVTLCHRVILNPFVNYIRVRKITSPMVKWSLNSLDHRSTNHSLLHNCIYCTYSCKNLFFVTR